MSRDKEDVISRNYISLKDLEAIEKDAKKKQMAINRASFLIEDAKARYIKEKTRARSKKQAMEKEALLKLDKFKKLEDYERFEDIQEAYGCDVITSKERDELEVLWDEREEIKNHVEDGFYKDLVTEALHEAWIHIQDLWSDDINRAEVERKRFDKERAEAEAEANEWMERQNRAYEKLMKGE